jgi:hypothetical protein
MTLQRDSTHVSALYNGQILQSIRTVPQPVELDPTDARET